MNPLIFVTGKGGVGKSFISALFARQLSMESKRVLLVETGGWSYLRGVLGVPQEVGFVPTSTPWGFDLALWRGEDCLREYVQYLIKVPWVGQQFLDHRWMKSFVQVAPGLREIAFLGKVTSGLRRHGPTLNYDFIVVDAVSTGHFVSMLKAPVGWAQAIRVGPVYTQCQSIISTLNDANKVSTYLVTLPESLVVEELRDLQTQLDPLLRSKISVLVNKCLAPLPTSQLILPELETYVEQRQLKIEEQKKHLQNLIADNQNLQQAPFFYDSLMELMKEGHAFSI